MASALINNLVVEGCGIDIFRTFPIEIVEVNTKVNFHLFFGNGDNIGHP